MSGAPLAPGQRGSVQRGHAQRVRCAIYTRKSSEEGLEQDFNSLDAQREACAAYVLSQASEGWTLLPEIYDDGGISGGTLERPALQRLLAEVSAGRIDIIVVYKVDRLTRSLLDFAKLVEAFDHANTSFVSVTQSFNTTTSMGRLTLNMLLSFAQFEREVTAERIRDKIAASKAKGMWMGGTPPLGYAPNGRSLAIVDEHAAIIRHIFRLYLEFGNVRTVTELLADARIGAPVRTRTTTGGTFGGVAFTRGQIYAVLRCPTYVGEVHHHGSVYPGLHPAIIDRDIWDRTQAMLAGNCQGARSGARAASPSLLAGLIVDGDGEPLIATHATKPVPSRAEGGKTRYRYYVSRAAHHEAAAAGMRIPALEIEAAVCGAVAGALDDPLSLVATLGLPVRPADLNTLMTCGSELAALATARDRMLIRALVSQVRVTGEGIAVDLVTSAVAEQLRLGIEPDTPVTTTLDIALRLTRTGRAIRLVQGNGLAVTGKADPSLIALIIKARRWWGALCQGDMDIVTLASSENVSPSYVTRVLRLAFLSPAVVHAALAGTLVAKVDAAALTATGAVDPYWTQQRLQLLSSCQDRAV